MRSKKEMLASAEKLGFDEDVAEGALQWAEALEEAFLRANGGKGDVAKRVAVISMDFMRTRERVRENPYDEAAQSCTEAFDHIRDALDAMIGVLSPLLIEVDEDEYRLTMDEMNVGRGLQYLLENLEESEAHEVGKQVIMGLSTAMLAAEVFEARSKSRLH